MRTLTTVRSEENHRVANPTLAAIGGDGHESARAQSAGPGAHRDAGIDREAFRGLLLARRAELLHDAGRTAQDMSGTGEGIPDPTDRGLLESDRNLTLRIRDRERKLISKIDEALERIADGSFGLCEECDEPIGEARLRARPVTTLCIGCKADQEEQERNAQRRAG